MLKLLRYSSQFPKNASSIFNSTIKRYLCDLNDTSPLSGISVIDMTRIVAGPYCSMMLGDLGANIIKVEHPAGGDEARKWGPPFLNNSNESSYFTSLNRNKRSICIDIKNSHGKIFHINPSNP